MNTSGTTVLLCLSGGSSTAPAVRADAATTRQVEDARVFYEMGRLEEAQHILVGVLETQPLHPNAQYYQTLVRQAQATSRHSVPRGYDPCRANRSRARRPAPSFGSCKVLNVRRHKDSAPHLTVGPQNTEESREYTAIICTTCSGSTPPTGGSIPLKNRNKQPRIGTMFDSNSPILSLMKPRTLVGTLGIALLVGCSPADRETAALEAPSHRAPDPAVLAELREIVELRQALLKTHRVLLENGRAKDDGAAELALAEAQLLLARERGQADRVIAELRNMVTTHERRLEVARKKAEVGAVSPEDVARLRIALLEARVRLRRAEAFPPGK